MIPGVVAGGAALDAGSEVVVAGVAPVSGGLGAPLAHAVTRHGPPLGLLLPLGGHRPLRGHGEVPGDHDDERSELDQGFLTSAGRLTPGMMTWRSSSAWAWWLCRSAGGRGRVLRPSASPPSPPARCSPGRCCWGRARAV